MTNKSYNLVDVIDALRTDIDTAIEAGKNKKTYFELGEIEVELLTQIAESTKADSGFGFSVLKFGGGFEDTDTKYHKIKFKLTPVVGDSDGNAKRDPKKVAIAGKSKYNPKNPKG